MDDEERPEEAARRELKEEVGIEPVEIRSLERKLRVDRRRRPRTTYFHVKVGSPQFEISSGEIEEGRWFNYDEMLKVLSLKERLLIKRYIKRPASRNLAG